MQTYERFCTRTQFETQAQGNSEIAYLLMKKNLNLNFLKVRLAGEIS